MVVLYTVCTEEGEKSVSLYNYAIIRCQLIEATQSCHALMND